MSTLRLQAPPDVAIGYFRLFVNRRAYTLQSTRPHRTSGRHYYYRPKDKRTGQGLSLTLDTIRRHLEGEITIGLYGINPATQCSKWVAIDADYENALADLLKLRFYFRQDGVQSALENSRRGGHLWIFLAEPLPARDCRIYVCGLALRLGIPLKGGKQREGIEVFPKHDVLKPGRYGNAIRGPLGIHRGAGQRFWFDDAGEDLEKQMRYLNSLPKMTRDQLARLIAGKAIPRQFPSPEPKAEPVIRRHASGPEFRILDHINTALRTVGHNNVTRCPSCAEEGHDRSGDNLSISIEDPQIIDAVSQGRMLFIATCNSIASLPPELRRRFTLGTFFFDLPTAEERATIWKIYLKKYGVSGELPNDEGWTGAEIKECCRKAHRLGVTLAQASRYIVPVARSAAEQIKALRQMASGKFISASTPGIYRFEEQSAAVGRRVMRELEGPLTVMPPSKSEV